MNLKKTLVSVLILILGIAGGQSVVAGNVPVKNTQSVKDQAIILTYHTVEPPTDKKEGVMQKKYHVFPDNFRAQMQYLKDNSYVPIPMKVYVSYLRHGGSIPKKSVVITFDDGWKNQYDYAYPILQEFGYPATFYIISGAIGAHPYMSWDDVITLDKAGMDIASHTQTHANLLKTPSDQVVKEITSSKAKLEEKLKHPVRLFAYPYYAHNADVATLLQQSGYYAARAGWTNQSHSKESLFMMKSQEVGNTKNPFTGIGSK